MKTSEVRWVRATTSGMVPPNEGRAIRIGDVSMALFNLGGNRFLAVDGACPHHGGPLCDGIVAGDTVVCPLHAWKVNLVSGQVERPATVKACVRTYPTQVVGDTVLVGVPQPDLVAYRPCSVRPQPDDRCASRRTLR